MKLPIINWVDFGKTSIKILIDKSIFIVKTAFVAIKYSASYFFSFTVSFTGVLVVLFMLRNVSEFIFWRCLAGLLQRRIRLACVI